MHFSFSLSPILYLQVQSLVALNNIQSRIVEILSLYLCRSLSFPELCCSSNSHRSSKSLPTSTKFRKFQVPQEDWDYWSTPPWHSMFGVWRSNFSLHNNFHTHCMTDSWFLQCEPLGKTMKDSRALQRCH